MKDFAEVCNSQGCGMVIVKTVLLLTQVDFGKNYSVLRTAPFQMFLKSILELISVCN